MPHWSGVGIDALPAEIVEKNGSLKQQKCVNDAAHTAYARISINQSQMETISPVPLIYTYSHVRKWIIIWGGQ
mgnify:CR=1 FL=1